MIQVNQGFLGLDKYASADEVDAQHSPDLCNVRAFNRQWGLMGPRKGRSFVASTTNGAYGVVTYRRPNGKPYAFTYEDAGSVIDLGAASWLDQNDAPLVDSAETGSYYKEYGPFTFTFNQGDSGELAYQTFGELVDKAKYGGILIPSVVWSLNVTTGPVGDNDGFYFTIRDRYSGGGFSDESTSPLWIILAGQTFNTSRTIDMAVTNTNGYSTGTVDAITVDIESTGSSTFTGSIVIPKIIYLPRN